MLLPQSSAQFNSSRIQFQFIVGKHEGVFSDVDMKESLVLVRQEGPKSSLSPSWDWRGFIYSHHAAFSFDFSASVD